MARIIERLANLAALTGGLVLTALIVLTCISVTGRGLNSLAHSDLLPASLADALLAAGVAPVTGDFELVEAGISFAIFAFLPLCQLHAGHAAVDVFASVFPRRLNALLNILWELLLAAVILLITWRLGVGMMGKISNGETTFLIQFPIWWAYAASFMAASIASLVAVYCVAARVLNFSHGAHIYLKQDDRSS